MSELKSDAENHKQFSFLPLFAAPYYNSSTYFTEMAQLVFSAELIIFKIKNVITQNIVL